jgi:hypothetical protein
MLLNNRLELEQPQNRVLMVGRQKKRWMGVPPAVQNDQIENKRGQQYVEPLEKVKV